MRVAHAAVIMAARWRATRAVGDGCGGWAMETWVLLVGEREV